jgi:hypothetical protein
MHWLQLVFNPAPLHMVLNVWYNNNNDDDNNNNNNNVADLV